MRKTLGERRYENNIVRSCCEKDIYFDLFFVNRQIFVIKNVCVGWGLCISDAYVIMSCFLLRLVFFSVVKIPSVVNWLQRFYNIYVHMEEESA